MMTAKDFFFKLVFLHNISDTNADKYMESDLWPTNKPAPEVREFLLSRSKATSCALCTCPQPAR